MYKINKSTKIGLTLTLFLTIYLTARSAANSSTLKNIQAAEASPIAYLPYVVRPIGTPTPMPTATPNPLPSNVYLQTFDGSPAHPSNYRPNPQLDVVIHTRGDNDKYQLTPMDGGHGPNCEAPPASHPISDFEQAVYQCKNHMMSAFHETGGGYIYFTPNALVDFSEGEAIVRFDMSTARTSDRDWVSLWLTPFEENLVAPVAVVGGIQGPPREGLRIELGGSTASFTPSIFRNYAETEYIHVDGVNWWLDYKSFLEPSATRRDTFELRISQDHIYFGMPDYDVTWIDMDLDEPLTWNQAVLQIGHASYNPEKVCNFDGSCGPNTWHWDNFYIEPAIPFTISPAERRFTDATAPSALSFDVPSPENARLRFEGFGDQFEISYDNGATWHPTVAQKEPEFGNFSTYWTPIPAGISSLIIRGEDWGDYDWQARDISIWSQEVVAGG